ncbi:MAG: DUF1847 domain-containing protein [Chlorobiaceae bacterium]|nr:DUF1847 domain-containing protein [Chlorobiaceae bacterium]
MSDSHSSDNSGHEHSCSDCTPMSCYRQQKRLPDDCLSGRLGQEQLDGLTAQYIGEGIDARIARASAEVEGSYYGKLTRVEEIIAFANRIGAKRIGLATCIGLAEESRIFVKVLKANDLEPFSVLCKVGSVDKSEIGIDDELKILPGCHESICNPILQARLLNDSKTELNVVIGLCVGHDSLFMKYSEAPVTTLITKDRLLAHNPAGALYTAGFYYKRILEPGRNL